MAFNKPLPEWNNPGVKPNQGLLDEGWKPDDKPPADVHNWWMNSSYEALKQLQEQAVNKDQIGVANGVAPLGVDGKVPASMVEGNTAEVEAELENHINKDIGHVRYIGGSLGNNAWTCTSDYIIWADGASPARPVSGSAYRVLVQSANTSNVTVTFKSPDGTKVSNAYPLLGVDGKQMLAGALASGSLVTIAFTGSAFFLQGSGSGVNVGTQSYREFNTAGSQTFTVPEGVTRMVAHMWGGGGGGGGAQYVNKYGGGGGGSGGYKEIILFVRPGSTLNITVGKGGDPGLAQTVDSSNGGTGLNGIASAVTGALNGDFYAHGGGGGSGGRSAGGGFGGFGALNDSAGASGGITQGVTMPFKSESYHFTTSNISSIQRSFGGGHGCYSNGTLGGSGGSSPSDCSVGVSAQSPSTYYISGDVNELQIYSRWSGGRGGQGNAASSTAAGGAKCGAGGGGGNTTSLISANGGSGANGLVILIW